MIEVQRIEPFLLEARQVASRLGVARTTFFQLVKQPDFPSARLLGRRSVRWVRSEVEVYAQAREHEREQKATPPVDSPRASAMVRAAISRPCTRGEVIFYLKKQHIAVTEESIAVAHEQLRLQHLARFMVQVSTPRKAKK